MNEIGKLERHLIGTLNLISGLLYLTVVYLAFFTDHFNMESWAGLVDVLMVFAGMAILTKVAKILVSFISRKFHGLVVAVEKNRS